MSSITLPPRCFDKKNLMMLMVFYKKILIDTVNDYKIYLIAWSQHTNSSINVSRA
jgi:hypothetical protein